MLACFSSRVCSLNGIDCCRGRKRNGYRCECAVNTSDVRLGLHIEVPPGPVIVLDGPQISRLSEFVDLWLDEEIFQAWTFNDYDFHFRYRSINGGIHKEGSFSASPKQYREIMSDELTLRDAACL